MGWFMKLKRAMKMDDLGYLDTSFLLCWTSIPTFLDTTPKQDRFEQAKRRCQNEEPGKLRLKKDTSHPNTREETSAFFSVGSNRKVNFHQPKKRNINVYT